MTASADSTAQWKRTAAEAAAALVEEGMVIGLGSGSTASLAVEALAARVAQGLRIRGGIPTSASIAALARKLGVPLTNFDEHSRIDLTIDGADEVERGTLHLVKGRGGALLREKIVASASRQVIIVIDETKLVDRLGRRAAVPVEIVSFGWQLTAARLGAMGAEARLRMNQGEPVITEGGNYTVDCTFGEIADAPALERRLASIVGVIETGLFLGAASRVIVGAAAGARSLGR